MATQSDSGSQGINTGSNTSTTDFQRLLTTEARFTPAPEVVAAANVKDYQALYDEASKDLDAFWNKIAQDFTWDKP